MAPACQRAFTSFMNKVYFAMGLHFHQPVGNFKKILERAYQNCYKPFLKVFSKYPDIKMTFHFSGNLLDYFEERHPDFIDKVRGMVEHRQAEIMGGGYYEPIFQAIPQRDRIGQIRMLADYSEKRLGARPKGIWMPERVWSPALVEDFHRCGVRYSILDDIHLIRAGVKEKEMYGYFMAGDKDKIAIFPSSKTLRYIIPFRAPRETINYLRKIARKKKEALLTYGDDGEKFGEWPWTHDWVYNRGWLKNFFEELVKNKDWIKVVTFSEYLDSHSSLKDADIPEGAYEEMLEWSKGSWMNFLSKYPESNQMHKRMVYVSNRINNSETLNSKSETLKKLEEAKRELYKGQTNCPYWHGVFGGIYLYHLRRAVFKHLINAEKIIDEIEHKDEHNWIDTKDIDFYGEGSKAVILENKNFFVCIDPAAGGVIRELDYKRKSVNLINTLMRHKEAYHKKILDRINGKVTEPVSIHEAIKSMDERIRKGIFYDKYMRACLVDHFIEKDLKKEDFVNCNYIDMGDFSVAPYLANIEKDRIILVRQGTVNGNAIEIQKEIEILSDTEIKISYVLKNNSSSAIDNLFGMEFNITMPNGNPASYKYSEDSFLIKDSQEELSLNLIFSERPREAWHFPVMTVSQSERAYDFSYQSSCIFPIWHIKLDAKSETTFAISLHLL